MAEFLSNYFYKSAACGKYGMKGRGRLTMKTYFNFKSCSRWWCKSCGAKNGKIHIARLSRLYEVWGKITEKSTAAEVVFTVPESERWRFQIKSGPSCMHHMVKRIIAKVFPGVPCVQAFQAFGDKDPAILKPHAHAAMKPAPGATLKLTPEKLNLLRKLWKKALLGYGCRIEGEVDVHYRYARGVKSVMHMLRYLTRPCPGPKNAAALADNPELLHFLVDTLHRSKWIRFYFWPKKVKSEAEDPDGDVKCMNKLAGEKIDWDYYTVIKRICFDMEYVASEYTVLKPGFLRIDST